MTTAYSNNETFKDMQENNDIIIKETDIEKCEVILRKTYYKTKIYEILRDETNY